MIKKSKRILSLILSVLMVITMLPTFALTASAATSTIQMTAMGCFRNGNAQRVGGDYISVCNDSQNSNFDIAVFNFDISSLSFKSYNEVSAMFNYYTQITESENKGVSFYYPTANLSEFEIANNYQGQPNQSIWTGNDGNHLSRAISYYGLQPLQLGITTSSTKTTGNLNIGAAIKFAKLQGNSIATAVAVIASPGQSAQTGGWTDTSVGYSSKSVSVNITEVSAKEYVKQNIDNVKTSYPNISENNAGSFASNLVVADSWGSRVENTFAVNEDSKNDDTIRVHGYSNAVAIYTGSNGVKFPVVLEKVANSDQSNKFDLYQQIEHVALENGGSFSLGSTWEYCNSSTDFTSKALTTTSGDYVRNISSNINTTLTTDQGNGGDINTAKNDKFATELGKSFKNYIAYNGTGNTSSYYDKLAAPVFDYQADYAIYWAETNWVGSITGWKITNVNSFNKNLTSNGNYYVINMKPLLDITTSSTFKSNFLNVYNNESKYETASLNAYYQTMADIVAFDLTSRGLDTEQKIASVASEIKSMVSSYALPTLKTITVQFVNFAGDTVKRVTLNPGEAIGEFPANTATAPDEYGFGDTHHNKFTWNTTLTAESVPTSDITISENAALEAHKSETPATCTTKQTCDACGATFGNFGSHNLAETAANDATCTEAGNSAYWTCSDCGKMFSDADATTEIKEVPTISATGHSLAKVDEVPSTCTVKGTAAYWTCTACNKMFSDEQGANEISAPVELPLADHSYDMVKTPATCTEASTETYTCSSCGDSYSTHVDPATGHDWGDWTSISDTQHKRVCANDNSHVETKDHNIVNNACTDCGYVSLDMVAYDKAVAEYNALKNDSEYATKYTSTSITEYESLVDAEIAKESTFATQEEVDAAAAAILSAKTKLVYAKADVKVYIAREGVDPVLVDTISKNYGETADINVADKLLAGEYIAKWVIETQENKVNTKLATTDTTVSMVVTEPADVYVHIASEVATETEQYSKVSFISKNGAVSFVKYVKAGETLNTDTVDGVEIPFYKFIGWSKASVTADGSDIEVKAIYEFIEAEVNMCTVHYNGTSKKYAYDKFVYIDGAENKTLALSKSENESDIITYLNENAFYAPHIEDIYVIEVQTQKASIGITGTYFLAASKPSDSKIFAFNCKMFLPEGCTLVETGLIAKSEKGTIKSKVEKVSSRGEFTAKLKVGANSTVTSVTGKAYLTYKNESNQLVTIYSEEVVLAQ